MSERPKFRQRQVHPKPMIKDILLLSGVLCAIAVVGIFLAALWQAPEGVEDESGFHFLQGNRPVSRPPFAARGKHLRAKKNDCAPSHQLPAA